MMPKLNAPVSARVNTWGATMICAIYRREFTVAPLVRLSVLALLSSVSAAAVAQVGQADKPKDGMEAGQDYSLAEVVVTAEKRESTVQRTPISITAISGADLSARGLTSVLAVAQETPGISFRSSGPGQTEYEMRGLSSSGGSSATVGFYVDEVPISPPAFGGIGKVVIDPDLYDLERIEVLRGPQGTLYGSGSMGGTIKLITHRPVLNELDGSVSVTVSDTDGGGLNRGGNLMLNVPLVNDLMAFRLVVSSRYVDGWLDRVVASPFPFPTNTGCPASTFAVYGCNRGNVTAAPVVDDYKRVNWQRVQNLRPSLLIAPSDALTVTLSALYEHTTMGGYSNFDIPPGDSDGAIVGHYEPFDIPEPFSDTVKLLSAVVSYDGTGFKFTSATSFWTRDERQTQDASELIQNLLFAPAFVSLPYTESDQSQQFSQELRVASSGDQRFQWLAGAFYSSFQYRFLQNVANPYFADFSAGGAAANPQGLLYGADIPYDMKQYAIFAEGSYQLTSTLKFTTGLRLFKYDSDVDANQAGIFTQNGNATPAIVAVSTSDRGTNPKFNLAYTPNDDLTLYATAAKGFRPGGVSQPLPVAGPGNCLPSLESLGLGGNALQYRPDSIWNYEIGEKGRLLDGRLVINSDVYYIRWNDIQQTIPLSCGSILDINAGRARSYGPEIEVTAKLARPLTMTFSGAYTNSEITDPASISGIAPGTPVLNIPKYTAAASLIYEQPIWEGKTLTARVTENLIGPQWDIAYYRQELPSYALMGLRMGLSDARWTAMLFADNLTNRVAILSINNTQFTGNIPSLTRASTNQPRTVGVDLQYKF